MYDQCVGAVRGFPLGYFPPSIFLRGETGETLWASRVAAHFWFLHRTYYGRVTLNCTCVVDKVESASKKKKIHSPGWETGVCHTMNDHSVTFF